MQLSFENPLSISFHGLDSLLVKILDRDYFVSQNGRKTKEDAIVSGLIPKQFKSKLEADALKGLGGMVKTAQVGTLGIALIVG